VDRRLGYPVGEANVRLSKDVRCPLVATLRFYTERDGHIWSSAWLDKASERCSYLGGAWGG